MLRFLERLFPYLLFAPAVYAIVFFDGLLYPYLTPKTLIFRATMILALAVFSALVLARKSFYFDRIKDPAVWIPGILLAFAYLSSFFGVDFYHSFWSIFDRGDGLLTLTALVASFYFLLLYADANFVRHLFVLVAWVASFVALIGVLQWLEWALGIKIPFVPGDGAGRVGSTLGNAAFLASYLGMTFFVTLAVAQDFSGRWRKAVYASAILQLVAILAAGTRGTFLALIAASFVVLLYQAWKVDGGYRSYARGGIVALLLIAALFVGFRTELSNVPFGPVARLASISLEDATTQSRLFIWGNVAGGALQQPILGVGAEHVQTLFNKFYDPTKIIEEWFDRTHNAYLDYFVQYGFPGFLLYLVLIGAFVREAWICFKSSLRSNDPHSAHRGKMMLLLLVVYGVQNFFVFDTATTLWLFFALYACLLSMRLQSSPRTLRLPFSRLPELVPVGVAVLIALLVIPVSIQPLRANTALAEGYLYQLYDIRRSVEEIGKGYALGTYADIEYGYQLYEWYTERQAIRLTGEARILAYRTARDILSENFKKYPYDARTAVYYAHVLDLTPKGEGANEEIAREVLVRAIELSPKRIQPRYLLANIEIKKGDAQPVGSSAKKQHYETAIQGLAEYSALVPDFAEPDYIIATLYLTLKKFDKAKEWADKGFAVYRSDYNTAKRAAKYYVTVKDWENARRFLAEVVNSNSTDYPVMYDLAKAEFLAGNAVRAKEIVAILKDKAPGLVETDPSFEMAVSK